MPEAFLTATYEHGVTAIDSGLLRPGMAAAYLVRAQDEFLVVEAGINRSVDRILETIALEGGRPEDVSHVIVTHAHLDHAGGAGRLMQALPRARLLAHPRAAPHLVDPSRLEASARRVYGDEGFDTTYGHLVPVDENRVVVMEDNSRLKAGDRTFRFLDAPGHARHHFVVWDETSRGWFSGDTFGISYRETDTENGVIIFPTTTPIQFDPPAMIDSIDRMLAAAPECAYLTHFGRIDGDLQRLGHELKAGVRFLDSLARRHAGAAHRTENIQREMLAWMIGLARDNGCELSNEALSELFHNDMVLNTQGLEFMLDHPR